MLFGMPTLIELDNLPACADLCRQLRLSFVELNMNLPDFQPHKLRPDRLKSLADTYGIGYTIHTDENLNPFDFNPAVAQAYQTTLLHTIALALETGIPVINLHVCPGVYFTLPGQRVYLYEKYKDNYLTNVRELRRRCEEAIGSSRLLLCLENTNWTAAPFLYQCVDLLLESPVFALTYDVGHDCGTGGRDGVFIRDRQDRLKHMHLHDAGPNGDHLPLGQGTVDIGDKLCLAANTGCRVVLETKTIGGLKQSVQYLRNQGLL